MTPEASEVCQMCGISANRSGLVVENDKTHYKKQIQMLTNTVFQEDQFVTIKGTSVRRVVV